MRILITGGGTGGHVYPGIAVARALEDAGHEVLFVGTRRGLEADLVPREGFELEFIRARGLERRLSLGQVRLAVDTFLGVGQAYRVMRRFAPAVVVGTGGYVCVPVMVAAAAVGVPRVILEQNVYPGLANRILSRSAAGVLVAFAESRRYFRPGARVVVAGSPVRREVLEADGAKAREKFGFRPDSLVVLAFGGSGGAAVLNAAVVEVVASLKEREGLGFIFVTGKKRYAEASLALKRLGAWEQARMKLVVSPYLYEMPDALACANLVIGRAGGIAIAEITARGLPSILVPSPNVVDLHQERNAAVLGSKGAALVIRETELTGRRLVDAVSALLGDRARLSAMAHRSGELGRRDATTRIAEFVASVGRR